MKLNYFNCTTFIIYYVSKSFVCLVYISVSCFVQYYVSRSMTFFSYHLSRNSCLCIMFNMYSTYFDLLRIFSLIRNNRNSICNSQFDNRNCDAASHCTIDIVIIRSSIFLCVLCDLFPENIFPSIILYLSFIMFNQYTFITIIQLIYLLL